ncbi:Tll0287-like domain-containing protein [Alkalinema pantanalense CENA528]|uniref:Tll0287-like domain-containing protein n=1 Tax=Alkalinema pantanalense TaxID=1620705 RepID=UPI003D6DBD25
MVKEFSQFSLKLLLGMVILLWIICWIIPAPAWAIESSIAHTVTPTVTHPAELTKAIQAIEDLDQMRSGLASTLEGRTEEPTMATMKEVCRPVGMQAQRLSQENGWQIKQIADKYRNPEHAPDSPQARQALATFRKNPDLMGFWEHETIDGQAGTRYYRRINVEASCLACHGQKNQRPQFIQEKYLDDRAYDFNVGDLRGMYSVFMPDLQADIQSALQDTIQ